MTESERINPFEVQMCDNVDVVWVPTAWHKAVFEKAGVAPDKLRVFEYSGPGLDFETISHTLLNLVVQAEGLGSFDKNPSPHLSPYYKILEPTSGSP